MRAIRYDTKMLHHRPWLYYFKSKVYQPDGVLVAVSETLTSLQDVKQLSKDMDQSLIMLQGLACLFIAAKNYEMDPTVPSSKKFLRQLPGY